jgi:FkbM family methyltransferase
VGAFDGSTTLKFINQCPHYRAAYVFEPDPNNFLVCQRKLAGCPNVQIWRIGAGRAKGTASFATNGSTSSISSEGALIVELDRLDDILPLKPTFIKMDIEGGEPAAIIGAEALIREHQPRLALCVYHKPGDFWRIPKQVLSINPHYDVYLRHYTESIYETVMFFVPRCPQWRTQVS